MKHKGFVIALPDATFLKVYETNKFGISVTHVDIVETLEEASVYFAPCLRNRFELGEVNCVTNDKHTWLPVEVERTVTLLGYGSK